MSQTKRISLILLSAFCILKIGFCQSGSVYYPDPVFSAALNDIQRASAQNDLPKLIDAWKIHKEEFSKKEEIVKYCHIATEASNRINTHFPNAAQALLSVTEESLRHIDETTSGSLPIEAFRDYWILQENDLEGKYNHSSCYRQPDTTDAAWAAQRLEVATVFLSMLARVDREIDPDWDPKESIPLDPIIPEEAGGGYYRGPSPKIDDPKQRAAYQKTIQDHNSRRTRQKRQIELRKIQDGVMRRSHDGLIEMYSTGPLNNQELIGLMDAFHTQNELKLDILKKTALMAAEKIEAQKQIEESLENLRKNGMNPK